MPLLRLLTVEERVVPLALALAALPDSVYESIDRGEPEWPILERLVSLGPVSILTGLALALSDFQLGAGGAARYWSEIGILLDEIQPKSPVRIREFMFRLMARPVASRLRDLKLARIDKLLGSGVPAFLASRTVEELGREPLVLWRAVAAGMRQLPQAKTIAFSMKVFDLMHRTTTGHYATFPPDVPIVADLRIARVSLSSGLLRPADDAPVLAAMAAVAGAETVDQERVRAVWAKVAQAAVRLSLFRIDSLAWQVAEPIYRRRRNRTAAEEAVRSVMDGYRPPDGCAGQVATELVAAL